MSRSRFVLASLLPTRALLRSGTYCDRRRHGLIIGWPIILVESSRDTQYPGCFYAPDRSEGWLETPIRGTTSFIV